MANPRIRGATKALGAALLSSALLAAIAVAASTTKVIDSSTQSPNATAAARAACPLSRRVVGGGFALDPAFDPITSTGAQTLVQQSFPDSRFSWRVRSFAVFGGTDSTLYSVGLCRHEKPLREENGFPIAPATELTVLAKCPQANRHVSGGGFKITPRYDPATATGANVSVNTNMRESDVYWKVRAIRDSGDDARVKAYAICDKDANGRVRTVRHSVDVPDVGTYTATAHCRGLTKVVSGGFKVRPLGTPGTAMSTGLFPWVSVSAPLLSKDGWTATIHNSIGPVPDGKLTVYAYCKLG
jgi:hypothetical protein